MKVRDLLTKEEIQQFPTSAALSPILDMNFRCCGRDSYFWIRTAMLAGDGKTRFPPTENIAETTLEMLKQREIGYKLAHPEP